MSLSILLLSSLAVAFGAPSISSSLTRLSTPTAWTNVTWSGVPNPTTSDWLAVFCTGGTYYWWVYTSGQASGSSSMRLFANSPGSGCTSLEVSYYHNNAILMTTAPIPIDLMIQQVHLSLTNDPTEMVVDFVSTSGGASPACHFGDSATSLTQAAPATTTLVNTMGNVSHALLSGLIPGKRVFYACSDSLASSDVFNFTAGALHDGKPQRVAVFADFGVNDGFGLDQIAQDAANGEFDLALHAGDWAYNMDTGNSANGNFFMNRAMLYSSSSPTQPAPGNHEAGNDFYEYQIRHTGVSTYSNTKSALYCSFNSGLVHYLVFNSETYIAGGIADMLSFMKADLMGVNREKTPWVVAYSHKLWWMDATDFNNITGILQEGSVSADKHTYTSPSFVTMIVSGAPGDVERNDACPGDPENKDIIPACTAQYGYGRFTVFNASALYWEFTAVPTPIGGPRKAFREQAGYTDYLWLLK